MKVFKINVAENRKIFHNYTNLFNYDYFSCNVHKNFKCTTKKKFI